MPKGKSSLYIRIVIGNTAIHTMPKVKSIARYVSIDIAIYCENAASKINQLYAIIFNLLQWESLCFISLIKCQLLFLCLLYLSIILIESYNFYVKT